MYLTFQTHNTHMRTHTSKHKINTHTQSLSFSPGIFHRMNPPLELSVLQSQVVVVCNLKPSKMRGVLSEAMVLAASVVSPAVEDGAPEGGV